MRQSTTTCPEGALCGHRTVSPEDDASNWVRTYLEPHLQIARNVLDVGCGPGEMDWAIAEQYPDVEVIGVDARPAIIEDTNRRLAMLPNAAAQRGDATDLPYADDTFDLVLTRFSLGYAPWTQQIVKEMVRVCSPGGRVILQDLDGQLVWHAPYDNTLESDIRNVIPDLIETGFDPYVGRKLYGMVHTAGLTDIQVQAESYHFHADLIDDHIFGLWELRLDVALPGMTKSVGTRHGAEQIKNRFLEYLRRDDTLTYSVLFTVCGTKRSTAKRKGAGQ